MSSSQIERKLAAIMFTDIAGYTESMSKSESKSLDTLERKRSILKPLLNKYKGTFVKEIGDGTLSYFESAVNAATCAVKLQETTYDDKDMNIRVGIHIGDIVFKDGDVFGGGVNVAARLESIAPSGGVCVSKNVYDELSNQDDFDGIELGLQSLKGVGRLVEVFGLKGERLNEPNPDEYQENKIDTHTDDEVPSIAIIPFKNKGADEDAFYAYGISADLISDCSEIRYLRVSSLHDIEKIDYNNLNTSKISENLLVRYIVQGMLWKMGNMFQLSIELYDAKDKKVVWSDRWQESWDNLINIKSSIAKSILKVLNIKLNIKENMESILETHNTEAYKYYLKGRNLSLKRKNIEDLKKVRDFYKQAIKLDNNLFKARNAYAWTFIKSSDYDKAKDSFNDNLELSKRVDDIENIGNAIFGISVISAIKGDYDRALEMHKKALKIFIKTNNLSRQGTLYMGLGNIYSNLGNNAISLENYIKALDISETLEDTNSKSIILSNLGSLYASEYNFKKALKSYNNALEIQKDKGNRELIAGSLGRIGGVQLMIGDLDVALENLDAARKINEELNAGRNLAYNYFNLGKLKFFLKQFDVASKYFQKSLDIENKIGLHNLIIDNTVYLLLSFKKLKTVIDFNLLDQLLSDHKICDKYNFTDFTYYGLYKLLEEKKYLDKAYDKLKEYTEKLDQSLKNIIYNYPEHKSILEEWEKVK